MLPRTETIEMLRFLIEKTAEGQVAWTVNTETEYKVDVDTSSFIIGLKQADDQGSAYSFSILAGDHKVGSIDFTATDSESTLARTLYDKAAQSTVVQLFKQARQSLEGARQVLRPSPVSVHTTTTNTTTAPPPLPSPPSVAQVSAILDKIKGEWSLDYSRGTEQVTIDRTGNYYAKPKDPEKDLPQFKLTIIACDNTLTRVEWRKDRLNGLALHIEVMTISADGNKMEGFAKHDQHRLVYTRLDDRKKTLK